MNYLKEQEKHDLCICVDNKFPFKTELVKSIRQFPEDVGRYCFLTWKEPLHFSFTKFYESTVNKEPEQIIFQNIKVNELKNIFSVIDNFDWKSSIRSVCYFKSPQDETIQSKLVRNSKNPYYHVFNVEHIYSYFFQNIFKLVLSKNKSNYFYSLLNNLKRCNFKSKDDFVAFQKTKIVNLTYFDCYKDPFEKILYEYKDASQFDERIQDTKIELYELKKKLQASKSSVLLNYKYNNTKVHFFELWKKKDKDLWVEKVFNDDVFVLKNMLDIILITRNMAKKFNEKIISCNIKILVPEAFVLTYTGNDLNEFSLLALEHNIDLIDSVEYNQLYEREKIILDAFSHFTYETSDREILVLNIRSFSKIALGKMEVYLCEPVVFSTIENRFSASNLGVQGIEYFISKHVCNYMCNEFCKSILC